MALSCRITSYNVCYTKLLRVRREKPRPVLAVLLGTEHGDIGEFKELVRVSAVERVHGDPDADAGMDVGLFDGERFLKKGEYQIGLCRELGNRGKGGQDDEFIAVEPVNFVGRSQR